MTYEENLSQAAEAMARAHFAPYFRMTEEQLQDCIPIFHRIAEETIVRERKRAEDAYRHAMQWAGRSVTPQEIERNYLEPCGLVPPRR